ncbi:MAG: transcription initiation factor IIB [Candidatus Micrarchaeota archaeon]|nr:transcription initiation factor IIB [Candidatus Micrarchaeota archaeon]MCX8154297.1 transcription initiation factor IIB [Candidatus Micrarchaeota archaeon]
MADERRERKVDENALVCPECGSTDISVEPETSELICNKCGNIIHEDLVDYGPEWRAFDSDQRNRRARTGGPISMMKPNKGLTTEIDLSNKDSRGVKIAVKNQATLSRMRKWHKRISMASSHERNIATALQELEKIVDRLQLPRSVAEKAAYIYKEAVRRHLIRGRLIESVVAAVVYAVCRKEGIPKTLEDIVQITNTDKKDIGRAYRFIKRELNLKVPFASPEIYIPRFASNLQLSEEVQERAKEIVRAAMANGMLSGRGPTGIAAAALYIAALEKGERKTQKEVAEEAHVTEVTIRNRYRELKELLGLRDLE